jgi:AAA15 family ATPase/GTPase
VNKEKVLDKYPLEILIKIINDMGDYIIDIQEEEGLIVPDTILQALAIGCAIINESNIDTDNITMVNINNYIIGLT